MVKKIVLCLAVSALAASASADDADRKVVKTRTLEPPAAAADAGQRAFIDPQTKKLREPNREEAAALGGQRRAPNPMREVTYSDGSRIIDLGDNFMLDVVAIVGADGSVSTRCLPADAPSVHPARAHAEEK